MIDDIWIMDLRDHEVPMIITHQRSCTAIPAVGEECSFITKYGKECLGYVVKGVNDIGQDYFCSLRRVR